jgi:hypothetical protein
MNKLFSLVLVLVVGCAVAVSSAQAAGRKGGEGGQKTRPSADEIFKKLDTNNDGSISLDELKANPRLKGQGDQVEKAFQEATKDDKGGLNAAGLKEVMSKLRGGAHGGGKHGK